MEERDLSILSARDLLPRLTQSRDVDERGGVQAALESSPSTRPSGLFGETAVEILVNDTGEQRLILFGAPVKLVMD